MADPSFSMVDMHGRQVLWPQSGQSVMDADVFEARQTWQVFELPGVLGIVVIFAMQYTGERCVHGTAVCYRRLGPRWLLVPDGQR